ncbi:hypothetical protein B7982_09170 [Fibrobacter sp. UWB2]|uniref:hypothetical protein n=1 Tax=Fibrobacter sp. UWB2 TaxID=1964358 RepID=UPI000B524E17|nr:hypothetical protein [Fibrobacter sp. UWB2]OWV22388.1 hypothetical protein B7982_09170 [Fibrobacter sp. UWB2]
MKKCSLYELITLAVIFSLSFFAGCSSDKIAGTSEETNEFAYRVSSSSEEESSSSSAKSSSSSRVASSSSRTISSSSHAISSSSAKSSSSYAESSNSTPPGATSSSTGVDVNNNSSSSEKPNEGTAKPDISLDYYLKLLNQESDAFDSGVMATSIDLNIDGDPQNPNPPMTTEFDTPWPHKIVKQNVDALQEYFPMAFAMYPQIISAIKNETLDENCGLYTFNVYSDGLTAAYIVAEITENTIKVIDIPAGECKALSLTQMSRFLFYYCGEINSHAEAEHIKVDVDLSDNCPNLKTGNEWVKL